MQLALAILFPGVLMFVAFTELLGGRVATDDAIAWIKAYSWQWWHQNYISPQCPLPLSCAAFRWVILPT